METFTWPVDLSGASRRQQQPVRTVKFGDGYEQRQPDGIAPPLKVRTASRTGRKAEIDAIEAFLLRHAVKPFIWTPCDDVRGHYVLDEGSTHREALGAGLYRLSWTAREVRL